MAEIVEQYAVPLDLGWHEGDPISLEFTVESDQSPAEDVDWSGVYRVQIRKAQARTSQLLAVLDMYGDHVGLTTVFTIAGDLADSAQVPAGEWHYDAQLVNGITRFAGKVIVQAQVTG